jgi:hypothetical protein
LVGEFCRRLEDERFGHAETSCRRNINPAEVVKKLASEKILVTENRKAFASPPKKNLHSTTKKM